MLTHESKLVRRHKNPVGIFVRAILYPLITVGLWSHEWPLILLAISLEILNWLAMPPVRSTFGFIEQAIDLELRWLHAPSSVRKTLSIITLCLFPTLLASGAWLHDLTLLGGSILVILSFYALMRGIAADQRPPNEAP
jgi:hypothetical protein